MIANVKEKPKTKKWPHCNAHGVYVTGVATMHVPFPKDLKASAEVRVVCDSALPEGAQWMAEYACMFHGDTSGCGGAASPVSRTSQAWGCEKAAVEHALERLLDIAERRVKSIRTVAGESHFRKIAQHIAEFLELKRKQYHAYDLRGKTGAGRNRYACRLHLGCAIEVAETLSKGTYCAMRVGPNGSRHRVKSKDLPLRSDINAAQADLDRYAAKHGLIVWDESASSRSTIGGNGVASHRPTPNTPRPTGSNGVGADTDTLFDQKKLAKLKRSAEPGTALAVRPAASAIADVVERLTTEEKRLLNQREKEIERGAKAWLELGIALGEISEKKLYRATHARFEDYCSERWHIERSMAYGLIDAARKHQAALPIAQKLKIEFTAESQFRQLKAVDEGDLKAILKRAAQLTEADSDGIKRPTAKIIARAVRYETTPPEDLEPKRVPQGDRREATDEGREANSPHSPRPAPHDLPKPHAPLPSHARVKPGDSEFRRWNGQPRGYAPALHDLRNDILDLDEKWGQVEGFTAHLCALLHAMADGIGGDRR